MKRLILNCLLILLSLQVFSQGVLFDSIEFNKAPELKIPRGSLPEHFSLESYMPLLYPQKGGTCVAMSFALARTIMFAKENNLSVKAKITAYQMSPYYLYYLSRAKDDYSCNSGLNPIKAASIAKEYGFTHMFDVEYPKYYPFSTSFLCPNTIDFYPPVLENHIKKAKTNKVSEVYVTKRIEGIKYALVNDMPVVLAIQIPKSFEQLKKPLWTPKLSESRQNTLGGHAIVAIGYDDMLYGGAIRIANSWGDGWADQGKAWIRYADLLKWLDGGFAMEVTYSYKLESLEKSSLYKKSDIKSSSFKVKQFTQAFDFTNSEIIRSFKDQVSTRSRL